MGCLHKGDRSSPQADSRCRSNSRADNRVTLIHAPVIAQASARTAGGAMRIDAIRRTSIKLRTERVADGARAGVPAGALYPTRVAAAVRVARSRLRANSEIASCRATRLAWILNAVLGVGVVRARARPEPSQDVAVCNALNTCSLSSPFTASPPAPAPALARFPEPSSPCR